MRLQHISLIAAFFAYFSEVRISHIFPPHKLAFSTAILVLFVFILPISIRFRYLDHLVANRMAPSTCPDPCGTRWGGWFFKQFCIIFPHISTAYLVFMRSAYFFKRRIKLTRLPDIDRNGRHIACVQRYQSINQSGIA